MAPLDPAIAQAEPDHDISAKSLDDRNTFLRLPNMARMCSQRSLRKPVQDLIYERKGLLNFAYSNPNASVYITLIENWNFEAQAIVRRIGESPPRVESSTGRSANVAANSILCGKVDLQTVRSCRDAVLS
jgi:hypothetical protein